MVGRYRPFTFEERQEIERLIKGKASIFEIAKSLNRATTSIRSELARSKGKDYVASEVQSSLVKKDYKRRLIEEEEINFIKNALAQKKSLSWIRDRLNINYRTLQRWLTDNGFEGYSQSGFDRLNLRCDCLQQQIEILFDLIEELKNGKNK